MLIQGNQSSAVLENHHTHFNRVDLPPSQPQEQSAKDINIRERLRRWEVEHPVQTISDSASYRNLASGISIGAWDDGETFDGGVAENESETSFQALFEKGEVVDLGDQRPFLLRGDMVELRYGNFLVLFFMFWHMINAERLQTELPVALV
jgi:hypothetical protein